MYSPKEAPASRRKVDRLVTVCNSCGVPKEKVRKIIPGRVKDSWVDSRGFHWSGNRCRDCILRVKRERRRRIGILPREEVTEPRFIKAVAAERLVREWFEARRFRVATTIGSGPDLTCTSGDVSLNVEVKTVSATKAKGALYWSVGPVTANRMNDDLVAIVLPSGRIHFEDMKSHLLKCRVGGHRTVTALVREDFELEGKRNAL